MRWAAPLVAAAVLLVGCGGSSHTTTVTKTVPGKPPAAACPKNLGRMGCNTPHTFQLGPKLSQPAGPEFPDVSVWQGAVNWASVKSWQQQHGWKPAGIFKMGEFTLDSQATRNASELARLGFWKAGYWFVRATGCQHESDLIVWAAKRFGVKAVVLDAEVPEAKGYSACLQGPIKAAGFPVEEYTSPGSNPDSSNPGLPMWTAAFGPSHTPCVWTCTVGPSTGQSILAWQFTDGTWGPVVTVPGIGRDDVNVDYGITRLGAAPAVTVPSYLVKPAFTFGHGVKASEHNTALTWKQAGCRNPARRTVCKTSNYHLRLLAGRAWFVAHHTRDLKRPVLKPRWQDYPGIPLGSRYTYLAGLLK